MDVKCPGMFASGFGVVPQLYSSFRLLCHHHRLLARTNSSTLHFVRECAVPTYRGKDKTDRGCVAFLFHIHPLTHSGSQVAHSAERTDYLISVSSPYICLSHACSVKLKHTYQPSSVWFMNPVPFGMAIPNSELFFVIFDSRRGPLHHMCKMKTACDGLHTT